VALEQFFGFFAAIAAKICVQQIDHGPEMAAFFDVHLKQISQIVQRRRGVAKHALLFNRSRLRVALRDDQPAQRRTVFAGNLLPDGLAEIVAEADAPIFFRFCEKYSPAVFGHPHVIKCRPTLGVHADRSTQIDARCVEVAGTESVPPVQKFRLPVL
jgi:hypothetical protein